MVRKYSVQFFQTGFLCCVILSPLLADISFIFGTTIWHPSSSSPNKIVSAPSLESSLYPGHCLILYHAHNEVPLELCSLERLSASCSLFRFPSQALISTVPSREPLPPICSQYFWWRKHFLSSVGRLSDFSQSRNLFNSSCFPWSLITMVQNTVVTFFPTGLEYDPILRLTRSSGRAFMFLLLVPAQCQNNIFLLGNICIILFIKCHSSLSTLSSLMTAPPWEAFLAA